MRALPALALPALARVGAPPPLGEKKALPALAQLRAPLPLGARKVLPALALLAWLPACEAPECSPLQPVPWPEQEQVASTLPSFPERDAGVVLRRFSTSFESLDDFAGFYVVPSPHRGTTSQELSAGVHRAWIHGRNPVVAGENTNHRGYPTIQLHKRDGPYEGLVRLEFKAFLDLQPRACAQQDWVSLMTLSSYADDQWLQVQLLNVDAQGIAHLMHVPTMGQAVHDLFQTRSVTVPQRQWVTFVVLIDYGAQNAWGSPYIAAWQDGVLVSAARFEPRVNPSAVPRSSWPACLSSWNGADVAEAEGLCGLDFRAGALSQAHFGLYAPPLLRAGEVLNDELEIVELQR